MSASWRSYCSISAFGQTGPKAKDPGFDILAQASSGIMDMTDEREIAAMLGVGGDYR